MDVDFFMVLLEIFGSGFIHFISLDELMVIVGFEMVP